MRRDEEKVLESLIEAWGQFLKLDRSASKDMDEFDDDLQDFRKAIHDAERIVMALQPKREFREKACNVTWGPETKRITDSIRNSKESYANSPLGNRPPKN